MDIWTIYQTLGVETPDELGQLLLNAEEEVLENLLCLCRGFYGVQLGSLGGRNWLSIPFRQRGIVVSEAIGKDADCQVDFAQLPFAPESIDVLLLPHVIEFHNNPMKILEEAYRVLLPGGFLILLCFNSISLFGMKHYLRRLFRQSTAMPWSGHFYSQHYLAHWLKNIDFSLIASYKTFYRPPIQHAQRLKTWMWLEKIGPKLWPFMGASGFYVATKKTTALTPIRLRWESAPAVALKPATHRSSREQI